VGQIELARVGVLDRNHAALAAAVAQRLPLALAHLSETLPAPVARLERRGVGERVSPAARVAIIQQRRGLAHRSSAPTTSTCGLQRNWSTGVARVSINPCSMRTLTSRAKLAGSQDT